MGSITAPTGRQKFETCPDWGANFFPVRTPTPLWLIPPVSTPRRKLANIPNLAIHFQTIPFSPSSARESLWLTWPGMLRPTLPSVRRAPARGSSRECHGSPPDLRQSTIRQDATLLRVLIDATACIDRQYVHNLGGQIHSEQDAPAAHAGLSDGLAFGHRSGKTGIERIFG